MSRRKQSAAKTSAVPGIAIGLAALLAPVITYGAIQARTSPPGGVEATVHPATIDGGTTGSIARAAPTTAASASVDDAVSRAGFDALGRGDIAAARTARDSLPAHSLDRRLLSWAIATDSSPTVKAAEIADAARLLADWPGAGSLRRNAEAALLREKAPAASVLSFFAEASPVGTAGTRALARAHLATGNSDAAATLIRDLWQRTRLEPVEEAATLKEFGALLTQADHRRRLERMLYAERAPSALRVADLAGAPALAKAWIAVNGKDKAAASLLDAVPEAERGPGYQYAKMRFLRRAGQYKEAAAVALGAPTDAAPLVDPDAWWIERRALSRELLDLGDAQKAYDIAAAHAAESATNIADAEFHAGWYALRFLARPQLASEHFRRVASVADGSISRSRAHYWLGRAAEAAGDPLATSHFQRAASFGTAFYGQLAAARLGRGGIAVGTPEASSAEANAFDSRDTVRAIRRLEDLGLQERADRLYRDLAQALVNPGELSILVGMAERRGDHHLALRIGKLAAARGVSAGSLAYPVGAIPPGATLSGAGKALAYAIARQESEFKTTAVSHAGALGLLQLLPATAKDVAKKAGMPFAVHRLTDDAGYNATLGAAFLSEQLGRFSGSYVLTFAGYNAGPRRAQEWISRYGDPRSMHIDDVVDWIERIPYTETRGYVQRVMENYQIYKMRLTGRFDIASDLTQGRRS